MTIDKIYEIFLGCNNVCIDTRKIEKNDLFIAIKGENFDGNRFAQKAIESGACFAIVDNPDFESEKCILVNDSINTLQELARFHRNTLEVQIFALTGSNGKTTTKELCAALLGIKYKVQYTRGNLNNHLGVPLTLLELKDDTEIAIIEMGANHVLEIKALCEIALPECGLITNIGKAHIGEFGGYENIIKGKTELYDFLKKKEGIIFYNEESQELKNNIEDYDNSISYSTILNGKFKISFEKIDPIIEFNLGTMELCNVISIKSPLGGSHNCENIRAAISVASFFGLEPKEIKSGLENFKVPSNRSQWIKSKRNEIFLDAYNANPTSMHEAIKYFSNIKGDDKWLIVGEMLELGEYSLEEHKELNKSLINTGYQFILVGEQFSNIDSIKNYFMNTESLIESGILNKISNSKILIKASRGLALEKIVNYL